MTQPYLGEIKIVSFAFAPKGWALCNGQLMSIAQNTALFSILGTTYGGDGQTTFQLPDLQGRVPVHVGSNITRGEAAGAESHTLLASEMPRHAHVARAGSSGGSVSPAAAIPAAGTAPLYAATADVTLNPQALATAGGLQPHENRPPFLVVNFVIALTGAFPPRS